MEKGGKAFISAKNIGTKEGRRGSTGSCVAADEYQVRGLGARFRCASGPPHSASWIILSWGFWGFPSSV